MDSLAPIHEPHKDSIILAYGIAPDRGLSLALAIGVVILGLLGLVSLIWFGLTRPLHIPDRTALLISLTPHTVQKSVNADRMRELPEIWQTALRSGSRWPVVLGAYRTEEKWEYFALEPRWQARQSLSQVRESSGLVSLLATKPLADEQQPFSYTEVRHWWGWKFLASSALWLDPRAAFATTPDSTDWSLAPFTATYQNGILSTNLPFQSISPTRKLKQADLSLALPEEATFNPFRHAILERLRLGNIDLNQLPIAPLQINLELDETLRPKQTALEYAEPISSDLAKLIFSGLGLTRSRLLQLPDGSLVQERISLESSKPDWYLGQKAAGAFGTVDIQGSSVRIGDLTTKLEDATSRCPQTSAVARLSSRLTAALLQQVGGFQGFQHLPAITFASRKGKLVICHE